MKPAWKPPSFAVSVEAPPSSKWLVRLMKIVAKMATPKAADVCLWVELIEEARPVSGASMFAYVAAWEYKGEPKDALLHKEPLVYENIEVKERSYK